MTFPYRIALSKFNLPLVGSFYVTHAARALQSHDLSGEGIKLWITYLLFWPHKDMECLPGWVISPTPGPPPRQHKHERQYTPSTHPFIPTRRIWNDDYGGQMIFADLGGPKVSRHLSYRWGKTPKKTSPRKPVSTGDRARARCVTSAHATTCSTAVDTFPYQLLQIYDLYIAYSTPLTTERMQNFNSMDILISKILLFKLILICKFQNVSHRNLMRKELDLLYFL